MAITGHKTLSVCTRYAIANREGAVPRWKRSNAAAWNERAGNGANRRWRRTGATRSAGNLNKLGA